jgi:S1-C subfamily serine protease
VVVLHVMDGLGIRDLEPGDRIVRVAGRSVNSPTEFVGALLQSRSDASVEVDRERNGARTTVRLPPRRPPAQVGP